MNIIQMIILTLIAILITNAIAWFMIWRKVANCEEMLEDAEDASKCGFDVKAYLDELDKEENKWIEKE